MNAYLLPVVDTVLTLLPLVLSVRGPVSLVPTDLWSSDMVTRYPSSPPKQ